MAIEIRTGKKKESRQKGHVEQGLSVFSEASEGLREGGERFPKKSIHHPAGMEELRDVDVADIPARRTNPVGPGQMTQEWDLARGAKKGGKKR